ncbi:MAG: hypothetical protein KDA85_22565, partial [Planctomycetaceae bacterium]|nr:hypothetical protein [Planctomycetaceae bacterium]
MKKSPAPNSLTLRTYQVGFGDCFLLTFHYPGGQRNRNVLIDFGSTRAPSDAFLKSLPSRLPPHLQGKIRNLKSPVTPAQLMRLIAFDIAHVSDGQLDVVVATHRHKDHISGFATTTRGNGPGDIIRGLNPHLVVMPWTEHPKAKTDAKEAPEAITRNQSFAAALSGMNLFAAAIENEAARMIQARLDAGKTSRAPSLDTLRFTGENNVANRSAIENLMTMGRRTVYVNFGSPQARAA